MKLDTSKIRYITANDFNTLNAVEIGSRNHEVVPVQTIVSLSRNNAGAVKNTISTLAKYNLIKRERNAKYDGYKLSYLGNDFLAINAMIQRGTMENLGTTVGVGKESDIYSCYDKDNNGNILKIHRLGRTSFTNVKNKRDYLKHNQGLTWIQLSGVAANKEHSFLSLLHDRGFNVPNPIDYSRHCILMEWIHGVTMIKLYEFYDYKKLYSDLMKFIVKLANHGLIHCDFNEYNIVVRSEEDIKSGRYKEDFVVIDFPQSISIDHINAEEYFIRDVESIKKFFRRRFKYAPKKDPSMLDTEGFGEGYRYLEPNFKRDVKRIDNVDELLLASGYKKRNAAGKVYDNSLFEQSMEAIRSRNNDVEQNSNADNEYHSEDEEQDAQESSDFEDYDEDEYSSEEEDDNDVESITEENEKIVEALMRGEELKMDKFGNYILD